MAHFFLKFRSELAVAHCMTTTNPQPAVPLGRLVELVQSLTDAPLAEASDAVLSAAAEHVLEVTDTAIDTDPLSIVATAIVTIRSTDRRPLLAA